MVQSPTAGTANGSSHFDSVETQSNAKGQGHADSACQGEEAGHAIGQAPAQQQLSCMALVVLIFYNVCGGPFGSETAVHAGGPLWALTGFFLFPLLWSVPQALLTAELATTFPDDGGYVTWVTAAFGPFWGFQEGVFALVCGATDNAVYPSLFVSYLKYAVCDVSFDADAESASCPPLDHQLAWFLPSNRFLLIIAASSALSYFNWRGLELVGRIAVGLTVFMLIPFALLCGLGLPRIDPRKWLETRPLGGVQKKRHGWAGRGRANVRIGYDWLTYANVLFWNLNYWDSASTLAGEVSDPRRNFPRALRWAVAMVSITYILPMAVCIAALPPGQSWETGFFVTAGKLLGGPFLQAWILAAAAVSCIGQFLSVQAGNTYLLLGMAELGHVPACFAGRSKHGTPTLGIVLSLIVVLILARSDMVDLLGMLNGVYCLAQLLEFAAFIELRRRLPEFHRPYSVPLGVWGCTMMLLCPTLMCWLLLLLPYFEADVKSVSFVLLSAAMGFLLYGLVACWRWYSPSSFLHPLPEAVKDPSDSVKKREPMISRSLNPERDSGPSACLSQGVVLEESSSLPGEAPCDRKSGGEEPRRHQNGSQGDEEPSLSTLASTGIRSLSLSGDEGAEEDAAVKKRRGVALVRPVAEKLGRALHSGGSSGLSSRGEAREALEPLT